MPSRKELFEEIARQREAAEVETRRAVRWTLVRCGLACIGWMLVGLYLIGWALHTTDEHYGRIAYYGGVIVGNAGILYTLLATYRRLEQRGDI
jgi:hypothetical protein